MKILNINYASHDLLKKTKKGKHNGWGTFDNGLEGSRFQLLQEIFEAENFDTKEAEDILNVLKEFAESNGYCTADNCYNRYGTLELNGLTEYMTERKRVSAIADLTDLNSEERESDYFNQILLSEEIFARTAKNQEAVSFLGFTILKQTCCGKIWTEMNKAYSLGVKNFKESLNKI